MDLFVRTCSYARMNVSRLIARGFLGLWVLVCAAAVVGAFAGLGYTARTPMAYAATAAIPLVIGIALLALSFFYEVLAAVLIWVAAAAIAGWGVFAGWDATIWGVMIAMVIGPLVVAGFLMMLASRTQRVCELEETAPAGSQHQPA
jgi:hypothetical protein